MVIETRREKFQVEQATMASERAMTRTLVEQGFSVAVAKIRTKPTEEQREPLEQLLTAVRAAVPPRQLNPQLSTLLATMQNI